VTAKAERAAAVAAGLAAAYPQALCELDFRNPYELLVATILSAQCTDARVNQVTPDLFRRFPDAPTLARADRDELEAMIRSTGFYRNKAASLLGMAAVVAERHGGAIPRTMGELTALPGVGRKTANVVLGTAFGVAVGVVVDTHVARLSRRLGLTRHEDPERIERDLMRAFPRDEWVALAHRLILHGRRVCTARSPACERCGLGDVCPKVGVSSERGPRRAARGAVMVPVRRKATA
jgi:endonuclease-3